MTNNVQGNSHQTISAISQQKLYRPERNGKIYLLSTEREKPTTMITIPIKDLIQN